MERKKRLENKGKGLTRREFVKKTGAAGVALGAAAMVPSFARRALAAKRDYILIGHPNPSTGPLAGFGEASPWADNLAIEAGPLSAYLFQRNLRIDTMRGFLQRSA